MTVRLYRDDPYLLDFEATVIARRQRDGRPAVVLDRTAFYPEGGGQPWDTGTLEGARVLSVMEDSGEVLHLLDGDVESPRVHGRVDGERRRDHRQTHHGQHLLSRALVEAALARTVSFHMGSDTASVDLDRPVSEELLSAAERRANEVVWQALPVHTRTVSRAEAVSLGVDVPAEARDDVRLVEARGFDLQPCGGTHPANTAEVGVVVVLDHERYKGGTRVHFVCGHRALRVLETQRRTLRDTSRLLSCPWPELAEAAERLLGQLGETRRRAQDLALRAVAAEAQKLLADGDQARVTTRVYEGWTPDELRSLAERLVSLREGVVLLGSRAGGAYLCFAESAGLQHDIPGLVRDASLRLGGRGGGKGHIAQGRSDNAQGLEEAIAWAAAQVQRGPAPS